ncbi:hypothetical protein K502DRAFT_212262 [Neoconidiobolus thromboides FSU 785]|nr:hypothetical protein K502DRAFT_212262 [Neoconidiobolus thromboides FSU 785]
MFIDYLKHVAIVVVIIIVTLATGHYTTAYYYRRRAARMEGEVTNNATSSNTNSHVGNNNNQVELNEIMVENISVTIKNKFEVSTGKQNKISEKERYCVFFDDDCIIQAKHQKLNPESLYYEIKLVDFTDDFELLFGYADRSTSEIHGKLMFLVLVLQIC